ncbi:MAG: DEAD/DEAH box helicase [Nitrospinota bacterium]
MKFNNLEIHEDILKAINELGFTSCTPIQEQALPESLNGKDMISQSQTGTGKTAVFLITALNRLITGEKSKPSKPRAIIMAPTRELAEQIDQDAQALSKYLPLTSLAVYGGVGYDRQERALAKGVDIVAATPGRLIDFLKSKTILLSSVELFVIDEADRMFDMGFAPDIRFIADRMPTHRGRQTILFSATIESNVRRLAMKYMRKDPVEIEIEPEQLTVDLIDQKIIHVSNEDKFGFLMALLKREDNVRTVVFTNMKRTAERLGWRLEQNGFSASVLTGDVSQAKRQKIIDKMKAGKLDVLLATDVAARGLHIEDITHVINYDLPSEAATYVHRIGRTARAGKTGKAYSLVCEDLVLNLPDIERYIERKIEVEWVEEAEVPEDVSGNYKKTNRKPDRSAKKTRPGQRTVKPRTRAPKKTAKKEPGERGVKKTSERSSGLGREDRLSHYRKKYGENFQVKGKKPGVKQAGPSSEKKSITKAAFEKKPVGKKKRGVLKKIFGVFRKESK